jgi:hypothetical protein
LIGRRIINEPLAVDEPDFKLGALIIGKCFNGRAHNKGMAPQDRTPDGLKVGTATRSYRAPDEEIIGSFNHGIIPFPSALPQRSLYIHSGFLEREIKNSRPGSCMERKKKAHWFRGE